MNPTPIEELQSRLDAAKDALTAARSEFETREAVVVVSEGALIEDPSDANAEKLEAARRASVTAATVVGAHETRVRDAERAMIAATREADLKELAALEASLTRHPYGPELARLEEFARMFEAEVVAPMQAKQSQRIADFDRAAALARKHGDSSWGLRHARPRKNEAEWMSRVLLAKVLATRGDLARICSAFLAPVEVPSWRDKHKPDFDRICEMLDRGAIQ
jgi:hypothetical protein